MALYHAIRNAQDATPTDGTIAVHVSKRGDAAEVTVADSGVGMDIDFVRDRLFTPFVSTKGTGGMGLGAFQLRDFARQAGGEVVVESEPGHGTLVRISLPLCEVADASQGTDEGRRSMRT